MASLPKRPPPDAKPATARDRGLAAVAAATDPGPMHHAIRRAHGLFIINLPHSARSTGHFPVPEDHPLAIKPVVNVPNGAYRVLGAEWIIVYEAGRVAEFYRGDRIDTSDVNEIPNG